MAKSKKQLKKAVKKLKNRKVSGPMAALTGLAGGVVSHAVTKVVSDALSGAVDQHLGKHLKRGSKKKGEETSEERRPEADVAAVALKALAERGPSTVADLLDVTRATLTPLLRALQDVREFHLVEFAEVDGQQRVQLTSAGNRTATVLSKNGIRDAAARLLT